MSRVYNFSPGPAALPEEVLLQLRKDIYDFEGRGLGIMELSHRLPVFESILEETISMFRTLMNISDDYEIIFTTGGATQQYSMIPMNILADNQQANYINTGVWSDKAIEEAKKFGDVHVSACSKDKNFCYIPTEFSLSDNPAYFHFTSNNTIYGTQFSSEPEVTDVPLICDASSDIMYKPIDVSKYALIYASAQKNLGAAGVSVVIIRKDLLKKSSDQLPILLNYNTYVNSNSLYNTPPTFSIYSVYLVLRWLCHQGGIEHAYERNKKKAQILYDVIDNNEFYQAIAQPESRSLMNVTFRMESQELEKKFVSDATKDGFFGLKGHRLIGGLRASIYNPMPIQGCKQLAEFMQEFSAHYG